MRVDSSEFLASVHVRDVAKTLALQGQGWLLAWLDLNICESSAKGHEELEGFELRGAYMAELGSLAGVEWAPQAEFCETCDGEHFCWNCCLPCPDCDGVDEESIVVTDPATLSIIEEVPTPWDYLTKMELMAKANKIWTKAGMLPSGNDR